MFRRWCCGLIFALLIPNLVYAVPPFVMASGSGTVSDSTAPEFSSATVNGTALLVNWNEACTRGAGYNDNQLDLDGLTAGDNIAVAYQSGDGTFQWSYTAASAASNGDTINLDFDGTGNSIEDGAGNDLAALVSSSVTNNTPSGSPDCSEPFTTGDTGSVADNTGFEAEYDPNSKLSIASNQMVADVGTNNQVSYVTETSCTADSDTELSIKFKITFDDILDVDNGTSYCEIIDLFDDANAQVQARVRIDCSSGDITSYRVIFSYAGGTSTSSSVTMTGLAADTQYDGIFYWKKNASTGGASIKIGAWDASATAFNQDNSSLNGGGTIKFGAIDHYWGDGTTDTNIRFDDFEVYMSDQR